VSAADSAEPTSGAGLESHLQVVARRLSQGRVVPFLGAGANLAGRGAKWEQGTNLPSGAELSRHLAHAYAYPGPDHENLIRVTQYLDLVVGELGKYDELRKVFTADYAPTEVHRFLAELPSLTRGEIRDGGLLIVTTNYDDALERAFIDAGEPFDVVTYMARGDTRGAFLHIRQEGEVTPITIPNEYGGVSLADRAVILKIHGAVDREADARDSFVVSEDDYIDYLTYGDISALVPVVLTEHMLDSNFLFLGYGLADWNLRAFLRTLWKRRELTAQGWAVQRDATPLEKEFWRSRNIEIHETELDLYVTRLRGMLQ
jgi:SIR2-like domain